LPLMSRFHPLIINAYCSTGRSRLPSWVAKASEGQTVLQPTGFRLQPVRTYRREAATVPHLSPKSAKKIEFANCWSILLASLAVMNI